MSAISKMKTFNSSGPRTEPDGTPCRIITGADVTSRVLTAFAWPTRYDLNQARTVWLSLIA